MRRSPRSSRQRILASTRPRRRCRLPLFRIDRPSRGVAREVSLRARAPGVASFQGCPLRRVGIAGQAWRARMAAQQARASQAPSAATWPMGSSAGIWPGGSGSMGASPTRLPVTSTARISIASASIPRGALRHRRGRDAPCFRVDPSPSPAASMPALSISRCRARERGRQGMATLRPFRGRQSVLKPGPGPLSPARSARPAQPGPLHQARDPPRRLPQRQAKQRLQRQAGLDRGVRERRRPAATTPRRSQPTPSAGRTRSAASLGSSEPRRRRASASCGSSEAGARSCAAPHPSPAKEHPPGFAQQSPLPPVTQDSSSRGFAGHRFGDEQI